MAGFTKNGTEAPEARTAASVARSLSVSATTVRRWNVAPGTAGSEIVADAADAFTADGEALSLATATVGAAVVLADGRAAVVSEVPEADRHGTAAYAYVRVSDNRAERGEREGERVRVRVPLGATVPEAAADLLAERDVAALHGLSVGTKAYDAFTRRLRRAAAKGRIADVRRTLGGDRRYTRAALARAGFIPA